MYHIEGIKYLMNEKRELVPISKYEKVCNSYAEMLSTKVLLVDQGFKVSWTTVPTYDFSEETNNG